MGPRSVTATVVLVAVLGFGCRQLLGLDDIPPTDAPDDALLEGDSAPDAGTCLGPSTECVGSVVRTCSALGDQPADTLCGLGCEVVPAPHCAKLQPSGGAVLPADLDPLPSLTIVTLTGVTLNTSDGSITTARTAGPGVISGIGFVVRNNVGVFTFQNLTIAGTMTVRGANALALVATTDITVTGTIDARGECNGTGAGPGGRVGGNPRASAPGAGGGTGGGGVIDNSSGGGGGGHGGVGGNGGKSNGTVNPPGGPTFGDVTITTLTGGGGGGGGGGDASGGGPGGGGGGAVQLAAYGTIEIVGGINAGGCGGGGGPAMESGGGGGAGGAILIEAMMIKLRVSAILAVNGGGGGGSDAAPDGSDGILGIARAPGGDAPSAGDADGGRGGASGSLGGEAGFNDTGAAQSGAGGGGAVGRIRLNSLAGTAMIDVGATLSPRLTEAPTTTTQGTVVVQ